MKYFKHIAFSLWMITYPLSAYQFTDLTVDIDYIDTQEFSNREEVERYNQLIYALKHISRSLYEITNEIPPPIFTEKRATLWDLLDQCDHQRDDEKIFHYYLETLQEITNQNHQKQFWFQLKEGHYPYFEEFLSRHLIYGNWLLESQNPELKKAEYDHIMIFTEKMQEFLKNYQTPSFIYSQEWNKIVEEAQEIVNDFQGGLEENT